MSKHVWGAEEKSASASLLHVNVHAGSAERFSKWSINDQVEHSEQSEWSPLKLRGFRYLITVR